MSMGNDITNEVVGFCKQHGLAIENAKDLNLKIKGALEWLDEEEEISWENETVEALWRKL